MSTTLTAESSRAKRKTRSVGSGTIFFPPHVNAVHRPGPSHRLCPQTREASRYKISDLLNGKSVQGRTEEIGDLHSLVKSP